MILSTTPSRSYSSLYFHAVANALTIRWLVRFDEENKPGISNLISILAATTGESISDIEKRFEGRGYGDFKHEVADAVCDLIDRIQTNYEKFKNPEVLNKILDDGAEKACVVASETLNRAKLALGLK